MNDKLNDALSEVKEEYIAEAAAHKRRPYWLGAVAAVLAAAVLISIIGGTGAPPAPTDPALDNPGTISYMTCYREDETEYNAWREEVAAEILGYAEGAVPAAVPQEIVGTWKCWAWSRAAPFRPSTSARTLPRASRPWWAASWCPTTK